MWREYSWRNKQIGHLAGWKSLWFLFTEPVGNHYKLIMNGGFFIVIFVQNLHQNNINVFTKNAVFSVFVDMK